MKVTEIHLALKTALEIYQSGAKNRDRARALIYRLHAVCNEKRRGRPGKIPKDSLLSIMQEMREVAESALDAYRYAKWEIKGKGKWKWEKKWIPWKDREGGRWSRVQKRRVENWQPSKLKAKEIEAKARETAMWVLVDEFIKHDKIENPTSEYATIAELLEQRRRKRSQHRGQNHIDVSSTPRNQWPSEWRQWMQKAEEKFGKIQWTRVDSVASQLACCIYGLTLAAIAKGKQRLNKEVKRKKSGFAKERKEKVRGQPGKAKVKIARRPRKTRGA